MSVVCWSVAALPALALLREISLEPVRWLLAATVVPVLGLLVRQMWFAQELDRCERSLETSDRQNEMADELAGVARWSYDVVNEHHRWSQEMCRISGLDAETEPSDAVLGQMLLGGFGQVMVTLDEHANDRRPYAVEFEIEHVVTGSRVLRARACNCFAPDGTREQIFMVLRDITEEYLRIAEAEAERAAALVQAQEALRLANTDPLTGLANRRSAMATLDSAIMAARSKKHPLSLLVFDIDHFKQVNDTHGHQAGDRVLVRLAELVNRQAREGDLIARMGGEEFIWLMTDADRRAAREAAERLRWAIEAGTALAPVAAVTVSVGHATLGPQDASLTLFARADAALYEAKRHGRNQVSMAA
ncbi:GGDEF domain-containing protein [Qipengyuania marisflavi]|uniref:diguanylate cyclase n=1 Tax=Qipengyuania marisflavi TaxID=2486356 RepID=A0A5S3P9Z6_9SPHN|nr:GGDEF domain-containing protein [Qipengyuania marisflavi]TMM50296.1 GGDEF domain-containing protein [Qipengyuania marisflavi]